MYFSAVAHSALILAFLQLSYAATVTYDFNITWVYANPDGLYTRPVHGINNQWPIPVIEAKLGDQLIVNVHNQLGNVSTTLHFHGLYQNGTAAMDGPAGAVQCPIPSGSSLTYNFTVQQTGAYWYHSHTGDYPDGLRGPMIFSSPDDPYNGQYDEEVIVTLSDWYHDIMPNLIASYVSVYNPTGAEPIPDSAIMNDTASLNITAIPGKTYLFRIINVGAFASTYLWFEGHTMYVVEVDGVWTNATEADLLYIAPAQRYSVLITMLNTTDTNYAFVSSMDTGMFDYIPDGLNPNATSYLVYDYNADFPAADFLSDFDASFDDMTLVPTDGMAALSDPDMTITLDFEFDVLGDGANYAFFNGVSYVKPKVPTLYTVMSTGSYANNTDIYAVNTNAFVLEHNDIIDIIVNNDDSGNHPFHLHGHQFQVIQRQDEGSGNYDPTTANVTAAVPMRRDTMIVYAGSNMVLRFRADNPDKFFLTPSSPFSPQLTKSSRVWLFHCHIEWHIDTGLVVTMIEAPFNLQQQQTIPQGFYDICKQQGIPTQGNAAGNTANLLDLDGAYTSVAPLPDGFTARGIVALVFSCIAAVLGMISITRYGRNELKK